MILSAILVVLGLSLGIVATQYWDLRLSGVIVVPLFAIYTLYDVTAVPVLIVSVAAAYLGLRSVTKRTLLYGRQLLYAGIFIGALVPFAFIAATTAAGLLTYSIEMYALGSILPGIAAYNMYRVDQERLIDDIVASVSAYIALVAIGVAFVSQTTASWLGEWSPLLFAPTADVAQYRDVAITTGDLSVIHDPLVGTAVIMAGLVTALAVETVWRVRLFGIIALPLLALFFVAHPFTLVFYLGCVGVTYTITQLIHKRTLVYGRVLLSLAVISGVIVAIPVAMTLAVPGQYLLFVSLLAGIGGYNIHRLSTAQLGRSVRLSTTVFAVFVVIVLALSGSPFGVGATALTVAVGILVSVPGFITAGRLELQRKQDRRRLETGVRPT